MSPSESLTNALICLPDLAHFTEFMAMSNEWESHEVVSDILARIVESNTIGYELAEIEGDAIFFYLRERAFCPFPKIIEQCRTFYTEFTHLLRTRGEGQFHFGPQQAGELKLGLKIILHCGPIGMLNIRHLSKPIGQTVVEAHRLLKNTIPFEEYLLVTESVMNLFDQRLDQVCDWTEVRNGEDAYDYLGAIKYQYMDLRAFLPRENKQ